MRYLPLVIFFVCAFGWNTDSRAQQFGATAALADGQKVTNPRILGLDGDLLAPELATQHLHGADYHEWCLRWNRLAVHRAEQAKIPPLTLRGGTSESSSFTIGTLGTNVFRRTRGTRRTRSTSSFRPQVWRIGGYGGGPVTLYNPFVSAGRYDLAGE